MRGVAAAGDHDDGEPQRVHLHFEPHEDSSDEDSFSVGTEIFSPVPPEALLMQLGVSESTYPVSGAFGDLGVSNAVSKLLVGTDGTGCTEGTYELTFGTGTATGTATVASGGTLTVNLTETGSGYAQLRPSQCPTARNALLRR